MNSPTNVLPFSFGKGCPPPPSLGFEATGTSEFGDEVGLAGTGTEVTSVTVGFQSFGCGESGHWNKGGAEACKTNSGETFTIPANGGDPEGVTLHLYEVEEPGAPFPDTVGTEIASVSNTEPIPFRPSASEECTESSGEFESGSRWKDPITGQCLSSLSVPITFTFPAGAATVSPGSDVIWTVTFNTSTTGYHPLGTQPCSSTPTGCGYDSLNVGAKTYAGAPYAGTDVNPAGAFINQTSEPANLAEEMGWGGLTPLAQITTGP